MSLHFEKTMTDAEWEELHRLNTADREAELLRWQRVHELISELEAIGVSARVLEHHQAAEILSCPHCAALR